MNKLISKVFAVGVLSSLGFTACQHEDTVYSGPDFVSFSDTTYIMPVLDNSEKTFSVPVTVAHPAEYDRNYAVEVVNEKSTAARGYHFDFVDGSNNVLIKAGEMTAEVKLRGNYDAFIRDSIMKVGLRLVAPESELSPLYKDMTVVEMLQCKSFDMDKFFKGTKGQEGGFELIASFPFSETMQSQLVKGRVIDEKTMEINIFDKNNSKFPIRLFFDDSDPLNYKVTVPEQEAFSESTYGRVFVRSTEQYPSYFNTYDNFMVLWLDVFVPQIGSFGMYQYALRSLTDDETANMENGI